MGITVKQLESILLLEKCAVQSGFVTLTRRQAEHWCAVHVNNDWYKLSLMLMVRGYSGDYSNFTEVDADSVYELDESGCFIELPEWWDGYQLWRRG